MSLRVGSFAVPLREPVATARGEIRARRGFLVRARGRDGLVGLGEAAPLAPWTEGLKECGAALEAAAELLDAPLGDSEEALEELDAFCRPLTKAPAARHALALALLDLAAQRARESLGGYLARTRLGRSAEGGPVPVNALVPALPPEAAAGRARELALEGYRAFKLKLAGTLEEDAARAAAVRDAVGPAAELRLDANAAWTLQEAPARLRALRACAPAYVEQPVPADDLEALRSLRKEAIVRVAADEAAASLQQALRVLDAEAADVLVVKPLALGGPDRAAEVLRDAKRRGVACVVTTLLDGPVAWAGALQVALLLPEPRPACGLTVGHLDGPGMRVERGLAKPLQGPGLGLAGGP